MASIGAVTTIRDGRLGQIVFVSGTAVLGGISCVTAITCEVAGSTGLFGVVTTVKTSRPRADRTSAGGNLRHPDVERFRARLTQVTAS